MSEVNNWFEDTLRNLRIRAAVGIDNGRIAWASKAPCPDVFTAAAALASRVGGIIATPVTVKVIGGGIAVVMHGDDVEEFAL